MDWLSWIRFRFEQWRASGGSGWSSHVWTLVLIPLLLYFARRFRRRQRARGQTAEGSDSLPERKGTDSAFYRVEKHMLDHGLGRGTTEPMRDWLRRLAREGVEPMALLRLEELVALHYRYRFDPDALAAQEQPRLTRGVNQWLADYASINADPKRAP